MKTALVIGAGPAGLMAAAELARAGCSVTVAEAKPTAARKFLMAGKSGLNLTKDEPEARFRAAYRCPEIEPCLREFGPEQVRGWARDLGIPLFTGSSGRVFPVGMKASPLLRAWLARLGGAGVKLLTRWHWRGWDDGPALAFDTPDGPGTMRPDATVLALGGASWPKLGSDGAWVPWLRRRGVPVADFRPANMGLVVRWSPHMTPFFGTPLKSIALMAGASRERGEAVLTADGIEGGGIYAVSSLVRDGADLSMDLLPDVTADAVADRLATARAGESLVNVLRKTLRLDPAKIALLQEWARPLPSGRHLAALVKSLPVRHAGPAPIGSAISVAGGVSWRGVNDGLELRALPGVFVCGEMVDWEAPTGGYLLTGCLATGRRAGRAAAALIR